ncbi:MAG TPA: GPW/gp25 family protein [Roseiflexaceae bacterium]
MQFHYPFYFDDRRRIATADDEDHVRDMIEQLLFTSPGERVNRPDFGGGLLQMIFGPNSPELAAALQFTVQAGLQRWLGDVIELSAVVVTADDSRLTVQVEYSLRRTNEPRSATFVRGLP